MAESVEGGRVPEIGNPHGMDWTPLRDVGKAEIPVSRYVSDDYYAREKERIWRRSWLLIGRESDVSKAGDFFTFYLHVLSTLVIVIRGKDGELRAFHNVCQHRGAQIQHEACGSCRALTCAFHGWVYDLDGSLLNVPQAEQFEELDYEERKLKRIHLDTWGGFVFINLDPADQPEHTLAQWLGRCRGRLASISRRRTGSGGSVGKVSSRPIGRSWSTFSWRATTSMHSTPRPSEGSSAQLSFRTSPFQIRRECRPSSSSCARTFERQELPASNSNARDESGRGVRGHISLY